MQVRLGCKNSKIKDTNITYELPEKPVIENKW